MEMSDKRRCDWCDANRVELVLFDDDGYEGWYCPDPCLAKAREAWRGSFGGKMAEIRDAAAALPPGERAVIDGKMDELERQMAVERDAFLWRFFTGSDQ
jgi:hypothetical protein